MEQALTHSTEPAQCAGDHGRVEPAWATPRDRTAKVYIPLC